MQRWDGEKEKRCQESSLQVERNMRRGGNNTRAVLCGGCLCCCSHINSSPLHNAVRGRRTGCNNSGVEVIPGTRT